MSFAVCGQFFGISPKIIFKWYKYVLSEYTEKDIQSQQHIHDIFDKSKNIEIPVPILKPKNFGENMAIDDKNIGGEGYTIISNKDTGKIAMMIMSTKTSHISEALYKIPVNIRMNVKTLSKDLAQGYDWIARTCFLGSQRIADKFHVIKLALEALQAVRIRYRQEEFAKDRLLREEWKRSKKSLKDLPKVKVFTNGETGKELLARSRYLLFVFQSEWTSTQRERADILFAEFPEIKEVYDIICSFRNFYRSKIGDKASAKDSLINWYVKAKTSDCYEVKNFVYCVKRHEGEILNYFDSGHTNAFAESLNSLIQKFVRSNYGIRDRDFFHFRLGRAMS